jgi:hypothetical protein
LAASPREARFGRSAWPTAENLSVSGPVLLQAAIAGARKGDNLRTLAAGSARAATMLDA